MWKFLTRHNAFLSIIVAKLSTVKNSPVFLAQPVELPRKTTNNTNLITIQQRVIRANTKFAIVKSVSWCFGVSRLHAKVSHCWTNFEGPPVSVQSCAFSGFSRLYSQFRK